MKGNKLKFSLSNNDISRFENWICVPKNDNSRIEILSKGYEFAYNIHLKSTKTYHH